MGITRIGVVNGTGEWDDTDYETSMAPSFCRQIYDQLGDQTCKYLRGPSSDGVSVRSKAHDIADWFKGASRPGDRIYLAGYSRGASAAVYAAELLQERGFVVDGLFLFDAVARHVWSSLGGTGIPGNVALSVHAVRSTDPAFVARYEGSINGGLGNPVRPWFGGTALSTPNTGNHDRQQFKGSHGAIGGVGWRHVVEDAACQQQVVDYMNPYLTRLLGVTLVSKPTGGEVSTTWAGRVLNNELIGDGYLAAGAENLSTAARWARDAAARQAQSLRSRVGF
jgi:hypothetical protein